MFKSLKWEDWLGIGAGAWLLVSPWALGYAEHFGPTLNALLLGCALISLEMLNLDEHQNLEEWMDIAAGLWLVVSPFILGFWALVPASVNALSVGLVSIALAAWALSSLDEKMRPWWREHVLRR